MGGDATSRQRKHPSVAPADFLQRPHWSGATLDHGIDLLSVTKNSAMPRLELGFLSFRINSRFAHPYDGIGTRLRLLFSCDPSGRSLIFSGVSDRFRRKETSWLR
jgi:hypothetical protein